MTTLLSFQRENWRLQLVETAGFYCVYLNRRLVLRGSISECTDCFREYVVIASNDLYPSKFRNVENDIDCQK